MTTIHTNYAPGFAIITFNGPENEPYGRVWQEGGKLQFEGNASEAARQLFEQVIKRNNDYLVMVEEQNNQLHAEILALENDRDKWKNHHNTEVARARVLKNRTDLPVERKMLYEALRMCELAAGTATAADEAEYVVTSPEALDKVLDVYHAAERLVRCKGRFHSEQNYRALAQLFGVNVPDLEPLESDNVTYLSEDAWNRLQALIDEPPAPSEALRELMTRTPRYRVEIKTPEDGQ
ncbi:DUF1778 domain-containing protein [Salmonella enterica]